MRTIALTVAYDGTDWAGFQRQTRYPSIQKELEIALSEVMQHPVQVAAAGRTDAGVHALGQVVSLRTENPIPLERVPFAVNRLLPASIMVRRATEFPVGFHARFSATSRRYWYVVQSTRWPDPLRQRFRWLLNEALDPVAMQEALHPLMGRHDFAAFRHEAAESGGTTVRTLQRGVVRTRANSVIIDVQADAFLHQMMRLLVANLVLIGSGKRPVTWLEDLLRSRDRSQAGKSAPPCGLILMRVGYLRRETVREEVGVTNNEELSG